MRVLKNDKWEIHIDEVSKSVRFYTRIIKLGEIVCSKTPKMTLRKADFQHYKPQLRELAALLQAWAE